MNKQKAFNRLDLLAHEIDEVQEFIHQLACDEGDIEVLKILAAKKKEFAHIYELYGLEWEVRNLEYVNYFEKNSY